MRYLPFFILSFSLALLLSFFVYQEALAQRHFVDNCQTGFRATETKAGKKCGCLPEYSENQRGTCKKTGTYQDQVDNRCNPGYVTSIQPTGVCNCVLSENAGTCSLVLTPEEAGIKPSTEKSTTQKPSTEAITGVIDFGALESAIGLREDIKDLGSVVTILVPYLFGIAGILLLLYLIWGGFGLMLSRGDPKAVESAKTKITHAVIGFIIIFISYWLVRLLGEVLGISQFGEVF